MKTLIVATLIFISAITPVMAGNNGNPVKCSPETPHDCE
jgi:hypothetical protein